MQRVLIPRSDWEILEGFRLPIIYCPGCGGGLLGNSTHTLESNGDVNASVICPSCDFHDFVTLEGYSNETSTEVRTGGKEDV